MSTILVMGGSGGVGKAVIEALHNAGFATVNFSLDTGVDLTSVEGVRAAVDREVFIVEGVVNCCGVNALAPFDDWNSMALHKVMAVNAFALPLVVQALRSANTLAHGAAICNVISNAANIPMTHSLAYNASKAAQEMITRQMARELKQYCIFGVNPNKIFGTPMSRVIEKRVLELRGWTAEEARKYQLAALPAGQETPPEALAAFIAELMHPRHHPFITSCIFPYGGPQ